MKDIEDIIENLNLQDNIEINDIPAIDLYMDQVIQLFENKLSKTKRNDDDKILTKTMINNYAKGKLLMKINNKKYTKEHIILMSLIYDLKGVLSINDIKLALDDIVKNYDDDEKEKFDLNQLYSKYLDLKKENLKEFNEDIIKSNESVKSLIDSNEYFEKLIMLAVVVDKCNMYRKVAEKIIDSYFIQE